MPRKMATCAAYKEFGTVRSTANHHSRHWICLLLASVLGFTDSEKASESCWGLWRNHNCTHGQFLLCARWIHLGYKGHLCSEKPWAWHQWPLHPSAPQTLQSINYSFPKAQEQAKSEYCKIQALKRKWFFEGFMARSENKSPKFQPLKTYIKLGSVHQEMRI